MHFLKFVDSIYTFVYLKLYLSIYLSIYLSVYIQASYSHRYLVLLPVPALTSTIDLGYLAKLYPELFRPGKGYY